MDIKYQIYSRNSTISTLETLLRKMSRAMWNAAKAMAMRKESGNRNKIL